MQLETRKFISNDVYACTLRPWDISVADKDRIRKFGEPRVQVGGEFDGDATFTLPLQEKIIREDLVIRIEFDVRDHADAEDRANTWAAAMLDRISEAIVAHRAQGDAFTATTNVEIPHADAN
jgi:hypothetical protein